VADAGQYTVLDAQWARWLLDNADVFADIGRHNAARAWVTGETDDLIEWVDLNDVLGGSAERWSESDGAASGMSYDPKTGLPTDVYIKLGGLSGSSTPVTYDAATGLPTREWLVASGYA
jgi:hypothetical protein